MIISTIFRYLSISIDISMSTENFLFNSLLTEIQIDAKQIELNPLCLCTCSNHDIRYSFPLKILYHFLLFADLLFFSAVFFSKEWKLKQKCGSIENRRCLDK